MNKMPYQKFHMKLRQRGQAFIFTLVFVAAAGLIGLLLFNSGLLANTKTRLQNAADAAAYSASVLQARDHNFSAYTNRAMVANQVAVAQIVSLKSFIEDAAETVDRVGGGWLSFYRNFYPAYLADVTWDVPRDYVGPLISTLNSSFPSSAEALVKSLNLLIKSHQDAQQYHHFATVADMMAVAEEVIKKNDPQAQISTGTFGAGNLSATAMNWKNYTTQHKANDSSAEADRFADVVVNEKTLDNFIRNRASRPVPFWASTVQLQTCMLHAPKNATPPIASASFTSFGFIHAGGTILSSDKKKWEALDATQGFGGWWCFYSVCQYVFSTGPCTSSGSIDDISSSGLGGSGGGVVGNGGYGDSSGYKNNPKNSVQYGLALISPVLIPANVRYSNGPGATLDSSGGLQDYYRDMNDPTKKIPKNQSPEENGGAYPITVEAERPAFTLRTSSTFLQNSQIIRLDDQLANGTMRAMASAHAYFYRPENNDGFSGSGWKRGDDRKELANLFSPYWQSRLTDISITERSGSIGEQAN